MNKIKFVFKEIIFPGSFIFTVYNILAQIMNHTTNDDADPAVFKAFFLILACCMAIALVNKIFKTEMSMTAKVAIHYAGILISIIGLFVIMGNGNNIPPIFIAVTVIYAIIAAPVLIIRAALKKKENEDTKYDKQFK